MAAAGLLVTGLVPALPAAAAPAFDTVHGAAYLGADSVSLTSLPETLTSGEQTVPVEWNITPETFNLPFETVEVTGTAGDAEVLAQVEVIAPKDNPLVYFVDAGHGGDSQNAWYSKEATPSVAFTAVNTLASASLKNEVPDQPFISGQNSWGYVYDDVNNYKISLLGGDPKTGTELEKFGKYELGVRTNGAQIGFRLDLEPGQYTLASGFYEFYSGGQGRYRKIDPIISYEIDGEKTATPVTSIGVSTDANKSVPILNTALFTIPDGATDIALTYTNSGGEAPLLSWFAVAQGDAKQAIDEALDAHPSNNIVIDIDANDIARDNVNGLTFKGFGTLSANSTSALLMDYKSQNPQQYAELLRILFGGPTPIMNHVKIEMGNDRNNSTGPDVATMRWETEEANVARHPGFQLAADAKKINPGLKVSILRWNAPAWANDNDKIYKWYKNTILAAYREYGYMVDYVNPGVNESQANLDWTKRYAALVAGDTTGYVSDNSQLAGFRAGEESLYKKIQLVISDEVGVGSFGGAMVSDEALREVVDVAGFHYSPYDDSGKNFTKLAQEFDKEVWNSEAQATFSNSSFRPHNNMMDPTVKGTGLGGTGSSLEMANTAIKGFVESRRSHFVYQPAIGSFYEGGQYSYKEVVSARDPWSGWIHYDAGLAILQHFSNFAVTGWENADNTAGIWRLMPKASFAGASGANPVNGRNGLPNYMTMAAPDASDFSTVIVNDSEKTLTYQINAQGFANAGESLAMWETKAADKNSAFDSNYKRNAGKITRTATGYVFKVAPFSIATVTTLDMTKNSSWTTPLPTEKDRTVLDKDPASHTLWSDDFEYQDLTVPVINADGTVGAGQENFIDSRGGSDGAIPLFTWDRNGAFEAYKSESNYVLRQQVDKEHTGVGGAWNGGDPITAIGDRRWTNYRASVDVFFERDTTEANYAAIGARATGGDNSQSLNTTPYVLRLDRSGQWQLRNFGTTVTSGEIKVDGWHRLSLQASGAEITAWIDDVQVAQWTDPKPVRAGWVDLASGFHYTQFDNLVIDRVEGFQPYYSEYLDDQEMTDLGDVPAQKLSYTGAWSHVNGGSMYENQRSTSVTSSKGATISYTFEGTGIDLLGVNNGSAILNVSVDGKRVANNQVTKSSGQFRDTYSLRGLPQAKHTVEFELVSGRLVVDAVAVIANQLETPAAPGPLVPALAAAEKIEKTEDHAQSTWETFEQARAAARTAISNPTQYGLDLEGVQQLITRLAVGSSPLADRITAIPEVRVGTTVGRTPANLPATLEVTLDDDSTREIEVDWDLTNFDSGTAWAAQNVTGSYGALQIPGVVEVLPAEVIAFADINGTATGSLAKVSPAFTVIADLFPDLINDVPDQQFDGTWGHTGSRADGTSEINYKGIEAGAYNKLTTTGIYTSNGKGSELTYTFTIPAGKYTLAAGTHSWWADYSRTADIVLSYDGQDNALGEVTLDRSNVNEVLTYDFELEADGPVTFALKNVGSQSPMLSFVGLSKIPDPVVMAGIEVTQLPAKTQYVQGEELDLTGLEVTAQYSNNTSLPVDTKDLEFSGYDSQILGDQQVLVTYVESAQNRLRAGGAITTSFTVTVVAPDAGGENPGEGTDPGEGEPGGENPGEGTDPGDGEPGGENPGDGEPGSGGAGSNAGGDGPDLGGTDGSDVGSGDKDSNAKGDGDLAEDELDGTEQSKPDKTDKEMPKTGTSVVWTLSLMVLMLGGGLYLFRRSRAYRGRH